MILYFGKFNPINENHIRIIEYIKNKYNPNMFVIIPHVYDMFQYGLKSLIVPINDRIYLITERLKLMILNNICTWKSNMHTGLFNIHKIVDFLSDHFKISVTHVLYGSKLSDIVNCINYTDHPLKFKFIVVNTDQLSSNHNQIIIEKISSPNECTPKICSSWIRSMLSNGNKVSSEFCHPVIANLIKDCEMYYSFANIDQIITIIGPPGSGKTTIGKIIANQNNYHFISTGDIYRNTEFNNPVLFKKLELLKYNKKYTLFANAISLLVISEIYNNLYNINGSVIIEGLKCGNLTEICKYIKPVNFVININADINSLLNRIKNRKTRIDDHCSYARIDQYFKQYQSKIQHEIEECQLKYSSIKYHSIETSNLSVDQTIGQILSFVKLPSENTNW